MKQFKHFFYTLSLLFISSISFAQTKAKADVIVKLNGDELKGSVKAMEDNSVKFVYSGETLEYNIKKEDIAKIIFSSGRVEVINDAAANKNNAPTNNGNQAALDHHNKIAILPFNFLMDGQTAGAEQTLKVQNECYALLNNHAGVNSIIDNRTTNALLIKAGVNAQTMQGYTMQELCDILGVEYVITGLVTVDKTSQTAYNSNSQNTTNKSTDDYKKNKSSSYGSSYATNTQNYTSTLQLDIYNDKNTSVFSQNRKAFWHEVDAYKSTLEYLVKRCPLYKK